MSLARMAARLSKTALQNRSHCHTSLQNRLHCHTSLQNQDLTRQHQVSLLYHSAQRLSPFQRFGFSSSAPQPNDKEIAQSGDEEGINSKNDSSAVNAYKMEQGSAPESPSNTSETTRRRTKGTKRVAFSDSESDLESDLSRDDLLKRAAEMKQQLRTKKEELEQMKDKVLRTLAEMENVKERTRRESENAKKFAIQKFAKSLLDVADNLGWASSVAKEGFSKLDESKDTSGAVPQLKVLLEGVEMTEKQLSEVFKKFGLEKYDPINEEFDPNRHMAVFQVPEPSKPADHVAVVLKAGYSLHDRVIRPAEVGVTVATDN